ncbi:MAG TPA: TetR/AcrR family transcriptional regulator [Solirubrobacteraceae bacterium]|nr:TetR/AcrR family transcriptional regulator [Solirubrobacteraceae bacterium]
MPPRPSASVRRPEILTAAVELLREQGLWSVRVADVAERAHTSAAGVIYYFGTKHELFRAAIDTADSAFYAELARELKALPSARARLARLITGASRTDWVLWMDLWVYARRHPELRPAQRAFSRRWQETIAAVVRHGAERGEFATADPEASAERLAALTSGLAVHLALEEPGHTPEHFVAMALDGAAAELGCPRRTLRAAAARLAP